MLSNVSPMNAPAPWCSGKGKVLSPPTPQSEMPKIAPITRIAFSAR